MRTEKRLRAAAYIRMSSDKQAASPERQRGELIRLAERENCEIVEWYEDHGISAKESTKRKDFQRLMADAAARKFNAILLFESSRFSREDKYAVMEHWQVLEKAGVQLIDCQRGRLKLDDLGGFISAIVEAHASREEIIKLSARVVSGRLAKARRGERTGGCRVFGYDREFTDEAGKVTRVSFRHKFSKPKEWKFRLVPTDELEALEAVRFIFTSYAAGKPQVSIAQELNRRGVKTRSGGPFGFSTIGSMLANPTYVGTLREGFQSCGEFHRMDAEGGPVIVENAHEPIIPVALWMKVQRRLELNLKPRDSSEPGRFLLPLILRCAECGGPMYVHKRQREGDRDDSYCCPNLHINIARRAVENIVVSHIREQLKSPEVLRDLKAAIAFHRTFSEADIEGEQKKLSDLASQIERVENNLALADTPEDFNAIKGRLAKLREQRAGLASAIETRQATVKLTPEVTKALTCLDDAIEGLDTADRQKLQIALATVIRRVSIRRERFQGAGLRLCAKRSPGNKTLRFDRFHGTIEFEPGVFAADAYSFSLDHFDVDPRWRPMVDWVRDSEKVVMTSEVCKRFRLHASTALKMLKRAQIAGLVKWHGNQRGGWINADVPTEQLPQPAIVAEVADFIRAAGRVVERKEIAQHFGISKTTSLDRVRKAIAAGLIRRIVISDGVHGFVPADAAAAMIGPRKHVAACADFIAAQGRTVPTMEVAQQFGLSRESALSRLWAAEECGLIIRHGGRMGGWRAAPATTQTIAS